MREVLRTQFRFLFFRPIRPDLSTNGIDYVVYLLLATWAVGVGRYWDHPSALPWQYMGLGSVAYVFVLSTFLYLIIWPLRPARWDWLNVFVFVGLTSLPGILYAIPVERFVDLDTAQGLNATFLGIVALWRVALYIYFLKSYAKLGELGTIVAILLPITVILFVLSVLNLEHVVFNIMAGIREEDRSPNDMAYGIVVLSTLFAFYGAPLTLLVYGIAVTRAWTSRPAAAETVDVPDRDVG